MTKRFAHDYVTFDKYGISHVRCMVCNRTVKSRMEEPSKVDPSKFVYVLGNHSNFRSFAVLLSDNSVAFVVSCDECVNTEIGEHEAESLTIQIARGRKQELMHHARPDGVISGAYEESLNIKKVIRRLNDEELKVMFGGKA